MPLLGECVTNNVDFTAGMIPGTSCQQYYIYSPSLLGVFDPVVASCPLGEAADLDTCLCTPLSEDFVCPAP